MIVIYTGLVDTDIRSVVYNFCHLAPHHIILLMQQSSTLLEANNIRKEVKNETKRKRGKTKSCKHKNRKTENKCIINFSMEDDTIISCARAASVAIDTHSSRPKLCAHRLVAVC